MRTSTTTLASLDDADRWYRAVVSRDARFDGWVLVGVTSTGIYCRPSCPTPVRPKRENVTFHRTAAAAQRAGFRACKRCRPDAVPGSPAWNVRGDLVGRAMRHIADGVVDRDGVAGLARRLAVSERHLRRVMQQEVGAGPLAIARANRAQTARVLIETTDLPFAQVAFGAGFGSVRQFSDTVREVFATTPTQLRERAPASSTSPGAGLRVRLPLRRPFDGDGLVAWLAARAVDGVEAVRGRTLTRTVRLPGGPATVRLHLADDHVDATFDLASVADLGTAVTRCRRLLDLDADPAVVADVLGDDPVLRRLLHARPGLRVPAAIDGTEGAIRAVLGQQVAVASAATTAARLVDLAGDRLARPPSGDRDAGDDDPAPDRLFPTAEAIAGLDPDLLPMPRRRAATLVELATRLADGRIRLDPGADRGEARRSLLALDGIGRWTADYVVLRALGDPDVLVATDLVVRRNAAAVGLPDDLDAWGARCAPWRSYVSHHLWALPTPDAQPADAPAPEPRRRTRTTA